MSILQSRKVEIKRLVSLIYGLSLFKVEWRGVNNPFPVRIPKEACRDSPLPVGIDGRGIEFSL